LQNIQNDGMAVFTASATDGDNDIAAPSVGVVAALRCRGAAHHLRVARHGDALMLIARVQQVPRDAR
jgi:hypothetical protein